MATRPGLDALARALDDNIAAIPGAKLAFLRAGTATPLAVYDSADLDNSLGAEIEADAAGAFAQFWFDPGESYDAILKAANDVQIKVFEDISSADVANATVEVETIAILRTLTLGEAEAAVVQGRTSAGDGGGGLFVWRSGNQSAYVTMDPEGGVWVAPNWSTSGANGAWMRMYDGLTNGGGVNPVWFGAKWDGTTNDTTPNQACATYVRLRGGGVIKCPAGVSIIREPIIVGSKTTVRGDNGASELKADQTGFTGQNYHDNATNTCYLIRNYNHGAAALTDYDIVVEGMRFEWGIHEITGDSITTFNGGSASIGMRYVDRAEVNSCYFSNANNAVSFLACRDWTVDGCEAVGQRNCFWDAWDGAQNGKVTRCIARGARDAAVVTMSIAAPGVISWTNHRLPPNTPVVFTTTGALPTGLTAGTVYYVIATGLTVDTFSVAATIGGAAITTSGTQSGVHTATPKPNIAQGVQCTGTGSAGENRTSSDFQVTNCKFYGVRNPVSNAAAAIISNANDADSDTFRFYSSGNYVYDSDLGVTFAAEGGQHISNGDVFHLVDQLPIFMQTTNSDSPDNCRVINPTLIDCDHAVGSIALIVCTGTGHRGKGVNIINSGAPAYNLIAWFPAGASDCVVEIERGASGAGGRVLNQADATCRLTEARDALAPPSDVAGATYTVAYNDLDLSFTGTGCTVTLPDPLHWAGRELYVRNTVAFAVISASSNVVPLGGGAAATAILPAVAGASARLVSNGTNWIVMEATAFASNAATLAQSAANMALTPANLAARGHFRAHKNGSNQTSFPTTNTQITFGTEVDDVGGYFASSGHTPPSGQKWRYTATIYFSAGGSYAPVEVSIYQNGVAVRVAQATTDNNGLATVSISSIITSDGNAVTVYGRAPGGGGSAIISGAATSTYFEGEQI